MTRLATRLATLLALFLLPLPLASAQGRVPGETWLSYADPAEAGWSPEGLAEAQAAWEATDSAAYMVVEDGVVVAAWGDVERRFMCHSVRKSFMSGLYGIHVDAGTIDTEKTLADLGIDDEPVLTEVEKTARIEDLLRSRSGIFKLAAYEPPQNPKPERGAYAPGEFWCYNNFDFNTLSTIFRQETGKDVFEEFDVRFARPLGMQDYRARDGYYHYERDKSIHPAYPFRMSARDAARYGLLYLQRGAWGDTRILSEEWIDRSTASYSDAGDGGGYAYMWWTFDEPQGMYSARGVGGQTIGVLPQHGLVCVNRTDTYIGKRVNGAENARLVELVLAARTGEAQADPELVPLDLPGVVAIEPLPEELLARYLGTYELIGQPVEVRAEDGVLILGTPFGGDFGCGPLAGEEDVFYTEDVECHLLFEEPASGGTGSLVWEYANVREFGDLLQAGNHEAALEVAERNYELFPMSSNAHLMLATAFARSGERTLARELLGGALELDPGNGEAMALEASLSAR
jgi:CubicO group peptidase (beta-lactamase class C family)